MPHTLIDNKLLDVYKQLRNDYTQLWSTKIRGKSLEIITPHSSTSSKFISVFLLSQGADYVVSDGGYIHRQQYGDAVDIESQCYVHLHAHYEEHYKVRSLVDKMDTVIYYKKTSNIELVTSIIHDLISFITGVVSASQVAFTDDKEAVIKRVFSKKANDFIRDTFLGRELSFNKVVGPLKKLRFSAIVQGRNDLSLINYVTGSNPQYFQNSLGRANITFEIASVSTIKSLIKHQVALIDDDCPGYIPNMFAEHIKVIEVNSGSPIVRWGEREKLHKIIMD